MRVRHGDEGSGGAVVKDTKERNFTLDIDHDANSPPAATKWYPKKK
jgi:hypothetical protein